MTSHLQKNRVSVVLATRNEESNIGRCLDSLLEQTHPDIEIIVVDNQSKDRTREIAKEYQVPVLNLPDHINLDGILNFRGAQVNLGVSRSTGEYLFFPDADMTFDKELLAEAVEQLKTYSALYIPEIIMGKGWLGKIRNFERSFYEMTCIDAPRLVRRTLYEEVKGFDEKEIAFAPDDWDLAKKFKKQGAHFQITTNKKYHHEEWLDLKTYLKKKSEYTSTFDNYIAKWGKSDPDIKKQFGIGYRYFGVFLENGKWKKLLAHPLLTLGMYFLRFRVGVIYLLKNSSK
ncbi:MAG: glycosyltransferase family 2 protein [Candidatus Nitronauta litoralis]|uniref:Glycosyltransferase family 2 protein n=1 Tax=Candidatus Nitronauta litoralis TaxID=2705533 RepID=A0A7T0BUI2_9BACT|nr:MAG: glycosyltransferase family 2 protein [Candidatus Nitronauta litoralis]